MAVEHAASRANRIKITPPPGHVAEVATDWHQRLPVDSLKRGFGAARMQSENTTFT
jgi:hypothetical protein